MREFREIALQRPADAYPVLRRAGAGADLGDRIEGGQAPGDTPLLQGFANGADELIRQEVAVLAVDFPHFIAVAVHAPGV